MSALATNTLDLCPSCGVRPIAASAATCATCAARDFLRSYPPVVQLVAEPGPQVFENPTIRQQATRLLWSALIDVEKIDWQWLIANWDRPSAAPL